VKKKSEVVKACHKSGLEIDFDHELIERHWCWYFVNATIKLISLAAALNSLSH